MATERFFHCIATAALASGLLLVGARASAEGGKNDHDMILEGILGEGLGVQAQPAMPLPPRRPRSLEAAFAALQHGAGNYIPVASSVAAAAHLPLEPHAPAPVSGSPVFASVAPGGALSAEPQSSVAGTSVSVSIATVSRPAQVPVNEAIVYYTEAWSAADAPLPSDHFIMEEKKPIAEIAPDIPTGRIDEINRHVVGPVPPARPFFNSDSRAAVEAAAPSLSASRVPLNPIMEEPRPSVPPARGKSRLNAIIGDNPENANNLRSLISKYAAANGIPFRLADAVVRVESRYNPQARNGPYMGLMQIHPRTAAGLGYDGSANGLLVAETNLQYGIKYLAMAYRLAGGDTCGTVMRYQGGHHSVTMTAANRTYCNKVKMLLAENHN